MALVFKDSGGKKFDGFYIRFPLFCLVFWGIPMVLCCFFFGMLWRENEDHQRASVSGKLDGTLSRLVRFRDTADSLSGLLNIVWAKVRSGKSPNHTRNRLIRFLKKEFPRTFRFVLLDGKGNLVPEISDWQPPRAVLKKLFDSYREASFGNWNSFNKNWSIFQSLLGPLVKKEDAKKPRISVASHRAENAFVFISPADSHGQMLVHISQTNEKKPWQKPTHVDQPKKFKPEKTSSTSAGIAGLK